VRLTKKPQAVVFDWDGTLLNSERVHSYLRKTICEIMGLDPNIFCSGGRIVKEIFNKSGLSKERAQLYMRLWQLGETQLKPRLFLDTNLVLEMLSSEGILAAVATNRSATAHLVELIQESKLNTENLSFLLAHHDSPFLARLKLFISYGITLPCPVVPSRYPKPDPRFFDPVKKFLSVLPDYPESVLFVGDTLVDLECAKKNGFRFAAVLHGKVKDRLTWEMHGADFVLRRLRDLPLYIV
jgi:phosphoglycolate phosphatase-like HAD superfamily hydrolase